MIFSFRENHLPLSNCAKGMFHKSFCIEENETDGVSGSNSDLRCDDGLDRLEMSTRGELKIGTEYYSALEFCAVR